MERNSIKYLVFMFILIFSFNVKVNAVPVTQTGDEGINNAKELSCLYEKKGASDKVMLVQDKSGKITIYKHGKDKSWDELGWYVADAVPRWGDLIDSRIYDKETDDDSKISYLTSCPATKITLKSGGVRFYKEKVLYYHPDSWGFKKICQLEDSKEVAFIPQSNDYNSSSTDISGRSCDSFSTEEMWNTVNDGSKWATSCLYAKDVDGGCHIIRFDVNTNKQINWVYAEPFESDKINEKKGTMSFTSDFDSANVDSLFQNFTGNCPDFLFVHRNVQKNKDFSEVWSVDTKVSFDDSNALFNYVKYNRFDQEGINQVTGGELTNKVDLTFQKIKILDCDALFGGSTDLVDLLKFILNLIKVLVPLLLVGLGVLDFAKAIFAGSEDNMKKAQSKFIKRVIIAIAIFLVPSLLKLVLGIASGIWGHIDADLCGLL